MSADTDLLLPPSEAVLSRELARLSEMLDAINATPIESIWNAQTCPAVLLPWLAWALSVDVWDDGWDEATKRRAIADSPRLHRIKGSRASVDAIMPLFGCRASVVEWWERSPPLRRGTAVIRVFVTEWLENDSPPITPQLIRKIRRALLVTKPKGRSFALQMGMGAQLKAGAAAALQGLAYQSANMAARPETGATAEAGAGAALTALTHVSAMMRIN